MDRREALKKLAAGGALVAASPVILPSVRVAHAASPAGTDISGLPAPGEPIAFGDIATSTGAMANRQVGIMFDTSAIVCGDGSPPTTTYEWRIVSAAWHVDKKGFQLRIAEATSNVDDPAGRELAVTPPSSIGYRGPTAYSAPSYNSAFVIRKRGKQGDELLQQTDTYAVEVRIRWQCHGARSAVEATYLFNGQGHGAPTVTNTSWDVVSA